MPSPRWQETMGGALLPAMAAATLHAWSGPADGASARFAETLRKLLPRELFERFETQAIALFLEQPTAPEGWEDVPPSAYLSMCARCGTLKATKFTAAQNGRLKLEVLRDADWLAEQFDRGRTCAAIAESLDCTPSLVVDWAAKHGLQPPKTRAAAQFDAEVAKRHHAGDAPGTIARALETPVQHVRQSLARQGIANGKSGHHYFEREWWVERLVTRGMTKHAASREAGITPHNGTYYVKKFGLEHVTRANRKRGRTRKYPALYDAAQLRALIDEHGTYDAVAQALGCPQNATQVSRQCRKLLGHPKRWRPTPHALRDWWVERLDRGATTWELAEEAGIAEKSAREKLRVLGLLPRGYANNARRESQRRSA